MTYLDEADAARMRECLDFLRLKLAKIEGRVEKARKKSLTAFIEYYYFNLRDRSGDLYGTLLALEGRLELASLFSYLQWGRNREYWEAHYSRENYNKYKDHRLEEHKKKIEKYRDERSYYFIYNIYGIYHELEIIRSEGVRTLFDSPDTPPYELWFDPEDLCEALPVFRSAHLLMNIGLYDRTGYYVGVLRKVKETLEKRCGKRGVRRSQALEPMLRFEENILAALTASDPELARRHAARAIADQVRGVVELFREKFTSLDFLCYDLGLALCVAIAFDFDPDWARACCQAMFISLHTSDFHPAFFKAVELGGWLRTPEALGMPEHEQLDEMYSNFFKISQGK